MSSLLDNGGAGPYDPAILHNLAVLGNP